MTVELPRLQELIAVVTDSGPGSPLERIGDAIAVADELGATGDELVTHFVSAARQDGCSWSQIGGQLGVSKQAAQQGFGSAGKPRRLGRRLGGRGGFTRFTAPARAAVRVAQEEARELRHGFIGTEHLLLGMLAGDGLGDDEGGAVGELLRRHGVDAGAVRGQLSPGAGPTHKGHLPLTGRAKKALHLASEAAEDNSIGTNQLLLGLIDEGDGLAVRILVRLGVDLPELRQAVLAARR